MVITELLSRFADPEIIHTLSLTDKLIAGLVATTLGMGITFVALILLQMVIVLMDKLMHRPATTPAAGSVPVKSTAPVPEPVPPFNTELIAVISTVLAQQLKKPVDSIVIKNIERISTSSPAWSKAGIIEQMNSRFLPSRRPSP